MLDADATSATIFQSTFMEPTKLGPLVGSSKRNGATIELCRTSLSADTRGALRAFGRPKAPRLRRVRARITVPAPPFSAWARVRTAAKTPEESGFLAGAALVALHPMACHDHPIHGLWRQRLALANAAALACHAGRTEDEAALRPATAGVMPGIGAGWGTIPDLQGACCKPGGGSPNVACWTRLFAWCSARRTGWLISPTRST